MPSRSLRIVLVVAAALLVSRAEVRADPLAAGDPPLTQQIVDQTGDFLEWALDVQLTNEQRARAQEIMVTAWKQRDRAAIDSVKAIIAARAKLLSVAASDRQKVQPQVQAEMLKSLQASKKKDPTSRWLVGVYEAAHSPLVAGEPPLTRQAVDAFAELLGFMVGVAGGGAGVTPDKQLRKAVLDGLTAGWKQLDATQRQQLAQMPAHWAAIRVAWATSSEADRSKLRAQWAKSFATKQRTPKQSIEDLQKGMMVEKARHELAMHAIDAMGCAAGGCVWKYEYRWTP